MYWRLVELSIVRPTVDEQIDGLAVLFGACWDVLVPMLGGVATRAVFRRTVAQAAQKDHRLSGVLAAEAELDVSVLRHNLEGESPDRTRRALDLLAEELFSVLDRLLGPVLALLLREVETRLAARERSSRADEETE